MNSNNIIFLFSLPRSGSTLLQRILASHPQISTKSEPWLLLPFIYTLKPYGVFTEYNHKICHAAFNDFIRELPRGYDDYLDELRSFALALYSRNSDKEAVYFLDKTPRYYLIIPEIAKMFPESKFIFLFRNPLQVLSSIIETWEDERLGFWGNYIDLFRGPGLLAEGYILLKEKSIKVYYDQMVWQPEDVIKEIFDYLELSHDPDAFVKFSQYHLQGSKGDISGAHRYGKVERVPVEKWKKVLGTEFRKKYALKYLSTIGDDVIKIFGHDMEEIKNEIRSLPINRKKGIIDRLDLFFGFIYRAFEIKMFMRKIRYRFRGNKTFGNLG